jgi:hypothetical protein
MQTKTFGTARKKTFISTAKIFKIFVQVISFDEPKGDEKGGIAEDEECVTAQVEKS